MIKIFVLLMSQSFNDDVSFVCVIIFCPLKRRVNINSWKDYYIGYLSNDDDKYHKVVVARPFFWRIAWLFVIFFTSQKKLTMQKSDGVVQKFVLRSKRKKKTFNLDVRRPAGRRLFSGAILILSIARLAISSECSTFKVIWNAEKLFCRLRRKSTGY